ncbi:BgtA-21010 [Blumeria graminis f. sp. tritici]|uniref:BgtA-21010 n=2 Tax=Blumeria graminis f. sp. tritici TaxID=62690 RepID=A0A9X9LC50_BLUGR|nr:hypothetical protein BGT96224_A21010 [Blumeria graminis f. sp. tritici 96224]VCU41280.1 BgtA-21010 [Blumeria graminis f. sp. tritici]
MAVPPQQRGRKMITRSSYNEDGSCPDRNPNPRRNTYPMSYEQIEASKKTPSTYNSSKSQFHVSKNSRDNKSSDPTTTTRRRIPIACGRCRKRKIRCSGDPGNGGPCANCKISGNEICQFLRVSSQLTTMKSDVAPIPIDYEPTVNNRLSCRNSNSYCPPQMCSVQGPLSFDPYSYRSQSIQPSLQPLMQSPMPSPIQSSISNSAPTSLPSTLPYHVKANSMYEMNTPYDFPVQNLDYGMQTSPTCALSLEQYSSDYSSPNLRGWNSTSNVAPALQYSRMPTFLGVSGAGPDNPAVAAEYQNHSYTIDNKARPMSGICPFPASNMRMAGDNIRQLPDPSANRPAIMPQFVRSSDNYTSQVFGNYQHDPDYAYLPTLRTHNIEGIQEENSLSHPYLTHANSNQGTLSSSHLAYGSQHLTLNQPQEAYGTSSHEALYPEKYSSPTMDMSDMNQVSTTGYPTPISIQIPFSPIDLQRCTPNSDSAP